MKKNINYWIFGISFTFFFLLGVIFRYIYSTIDYINLFFESDSIRVLMDLTSIISNHYRTTVHPLFVILFQVITLIIRPIINNPILVSLVLQSLLSAGSILLIKLIFDKLNIDKRVKIFLCLIFLISFSQLIFNATIETYSFAQFFNILLFYLILKFQDKQITIKDYILLILVGIYILGITITNFVLYFFAIFYLLFVNKNCKIKDKKVMKLLMLILVPILCSFVLSILQYYLFPDSNLYFKDLLLSLFNGTSEEYNFITELKINSFSNQIKSVFCYAFISPRLELFIGEHYEFVFNDMFFIQKLTLSLILICLIIGFIKYFKFKSLKKDKPYFYLVLIGFIFNFCLHLIYGNDIGFLYTLHYQFLLIILIGMISKSFKNKSLIVIIVLLSIFLLLEVISNSIGLYYIFIKMQEIVSYQSVQYLEIIIILITILSIIVSIKLPKKWRIILIIFVIIFNIGFKIYYLKGTNLSITNIWETTKENLKNIEK